jgi:hypothetical protein
MSICDPILLCSLLCSLPVDGVNDRVHQAPALESDLAVALSSTRSIFLEGVLFDSGKNDLYSAELEFSNEGPIRGKNFLPGYVIEYLYPAGKSITVPCFVESGLAWAPRNDNDDAHSWYARVPSNQQGIGFRILKNGRIISERQFTLAPNPVEFDCREMPNQAFTWQVHANRASIALSYDHGQSWQISPTMRNPAGTLTLSPSQLKVNPHPWIFLQGFSNGVIITKLHVFGLSHP